MKNLLCHLDVKYTEVLYKLRYLYEFLYNIALLEIFNSTRTPFCTRTHMFSHNFNHTILMKLFSCVVTIQSKLQNHVCWTELQGQWRMESIIVIPTSPQHSCHANTLGKTDEFMSETEIWGTSFTQWIPSSKAHTRSC